QRGEIYWVNVPRAHTVGTEQFKKRPWLIVSTNSIAQLRLVIGVPLTTKIQKRNRQFRMAILQNDIILEPNSTLEACERVALTEQVRALSVERFDFPRVARVTDSAIYAIEAGLKFVMEMD
ncbi:MAG: type II toxin-antitoxin system PemK/MazF family toxin, partial [Candidatus Sulfotelmatobacter sp.]